ncbi:MAG: tail fiber domain-containing protein [Bacteroidetes bacterium]|nr:tail fiber domain-containing protein [Bacteroidota bacterium]
MKNSASLTIARFLLVLAAGFTQMASVQSQWSSSTISGINFSYLTNTNARLGIGSSGLPMGKVDIFHNSSATGNNVHLNLFENEYGDFSRIQFRNFSTGNFWQLAARAHATSSSAAMNFIYNDGTTSKDVMSLTGEGRLGIGTTTPAAQFHVKTATTNPMRLESTGADNFQSFYTAGGYKGYAGVYTGDNDMDFGTGAGNSTGKVNLVINASPKLTVFADGKVGIGATSPGTYKLYVSGSAFATGSWVASDQRFKKDIAPVANALELVKEMRGVGYDFNRAAFPEKDFPEGKSYGFIAQELQSVLPELVNESDGYLAVNYDGVVPVLVEAIKEQDTQIEALRAELEDLKTTLIEVLSQADAQTSERSGTQSHAPDAAQAFEMRQNTPNPFSGSTRIAYKVPENASNPMLFIFNLEGKMMAEQRLDSGSGEVELEASSLAAGMYVYTLSVNGEAVMNKRMIVNK